MKGYALAAHQHDNACDDPIAICADCQDDNALNYWHINNGDLHVCSTCLIQRFFKVMDQLNEVREVLGRFADLDNYSKDIIQLVGDNIDCLNYEVDQI